MKLSQLKSQGIADRATGSFAGDFQLDRAPSLNDATALIRRLNLTPTDCMHLLNAISCKVADQRRLLILQGRDDKSLSEACYFMDVCADEISNLDGVTV